MIDYLLVFADEETAKSTLTGWYREPQTISMGEESFVIGGGWFSPNSQSSILPISIVREEDPRVNAPEYWMVISTPDIDDELYNQSYCVQETRRPDTETPLKDTVLRTKLSEDAYTNFKRIEPVWAGAAYVWGTE